MSENIEYMIVATGFKSFDEKDEFLNLAGEFQTPSGDMDVDEINDGVEVVFPNHHRGGGLTCKQIIKNHFGFWLDTHRHIDFTSYATYLDQTPMLTEFVRKAD